MCKCVLGIFALLLLLACQKLPTTQVDAWTLQEGDLLFLDLNCGELCDAIEEVTKKQLHVTGPNLSHVGMVAYEKNRWWVYEAWDGVQKTPLVDFLARVDSTDAWHVARVRVTPDVLQASLDFVRAQLGKPYDDLFVKDNGRYYCSELIADAFAVATNNSPFSYQPMNYGEPSSRAWTIWRNYFKKLGHPIPEGELGVSPLGLYLSAVVTIIK